MKTFREFLSEQREASPEEVTAKKEFDAKFKTLNRRNVVFNPHSCHQFLDRYKNTNQRRLQYFVDTVSNLDMESKKYYLVFSKSLDLGMILNKNDSGKIFVITVLPKGKKQPKTDTELMIVEGIKIFEHFEIE